MISKLSIVLIDITALLLAVVGVFFAYFAKNLIVFNVTICLMFIVFIILLRFLKNQLQTLGEHSIKNIKKNDIKVFWGLSLIALPALRNQFDFFTQSNMLNPIFLFLFLIIIICYIFSNIHVYNIFFILTGYHYYSVTIDDTEYILISRKNNLNATKKINIAKIRNNVLIEKE